MKLSVIVPAYNVEQYIEKCLESVISNDLLHEELEIIVVDDESPDNSVLKVKPIAEKYPFVKLISQKNKGLGGARNTGIKNASGRYLLFLDSDDWVLPDRLTKLVEEAEKSDAEILEFSAQGINPDGSMAYQFANSTSGKAQPGIDYYNKVRYMNSACNKLYSRKLLIDNDLYFLERIFIEDFEFNTRVLLKAKRVVATDYLVSQYLQSPDSITRNTNAAKQQKMVNDILHVLRITKNLYTAETKSQATDAFFKERLGFVVATIFYQLFKNKASYKDVAELKTLLEKEELLYVNHPLHQKNKNIFRLLFLKNFLFFRIAQTVRRLI